MSDETIPVELVGVRIELPSNTPIVLLREQGSDRYLPIWIGPSEASSIEAQLDGRVPPRPNSHDLAKRQIDAYDAAIAKGEAVAVVDGKIVENLHVETARSILAKAAAIRERDTA